MVGADARVTPPAKQPPLERLDFLIGFCLDARNQAAGERRIRQARHFLSLAGSLREVRNQVAAGEERERQLVAAGDSLANMAFNLAQRGGFDGAEAASCAAAR